MIRKDTVVKWSWGIGTAKGIVEEPYTSKTTKTIKGNQVIRNGEKNNKALYIKQDDGAFVLKSENEVAQVG